MVTALLYADKISEKLNELCSKQIEKIGDIEISHWKSKNEMIIRALNYPDSIGAISKILSIAQNVILYLDSVSPYSAELALAIEYSCMKNIVILYDNEEALKDFKRIFSKQSIANWKALNTEDLNDLSFQKNTDESDRSIISIDKNFIVKGIGDVSIGFIATGSIKKGDHLYLMPSGKGVTVRNIQIMDVDTNTAKAGDYVGLALVGANEKEISSSFMLSATEEKYNKFNVKFDQCPVYDGDPFSKSLSVSIFGQNQILRLQKDNENVLAELSYPVPLFKEALVTDLSLQKGKNRVVGNIAPLNIK